MPYHIGWWCARRHKRVESNAPEDQRPNCSICGEPMLHTQGYSNEEIAAIQTQVFGHSWKNRSQRKWRK